MAPEDDRPRRGLLIDWGGVLYAGLFDSFATFCRREGIAPETVRRAFREDPEARKLLEDFERGHIGVDVYEPALAAALGVDDHEHLIVRLFEHMVPDEELFEAVRAFRQAGIRTGLLSNSWGADFYPRERFDELFDVLVISGELGTRKPEDRIYEVAVERMGMAPEELVFVDDLPGNLKPARAMGMATVLHRTGPQTIGELEELLGVRVGPGGV